MPIPTDSHFALIAHLSRLGPDYDAAGNLYFGLNLATAWVQKTAPCPQPADANSVFFRPWRWNAVTGVTVLVHDDVGNWSNPQVANCIAIDPPTPALANFLTTLDWRFSQIGEQLGYPAQAIWDPQAGPNTGNPEDQLLYNFHAHLATLPYPIAQWLNGSMCFSISNQATFTIGGAPVTKPIGPNFTVLAVPNFNPDGAGLRAPDPAAVGPLIGNPQIYQWAYSGAPDVCAYLQPWSDRPSPARTPASVPPGEKPIQDLEKLWVRQDVPWFADDWVAQMEGRLATAFDLGQRLIDFLRNQLAHQSDATSPTHPELLDYKALQDAVLCAIRDVAGLGLHQPPDGVPMLDRLLATAEPLSFPALKQIPDLAGTSLATLPDAALAAYQEGLGQTFRAAVQYFDRRTDLDSWKQQILQASPELASLKCLQLDSTTPVSFHDPSDRLNELERLQSALASEKKLALLLRNGWQRTTENDLDIGSGTYEFDDFGTAPAGFAIPTAAGPTSWSLAATPGSKYLSAGSGTLDQTIVLVRGVEPNREYSLSVAMSCPVFPQDFLAVTAYCLGTHTAADFDPQPGHGWCDVKRFGGSGENDNGGRWRVYQTNFRTGNADHVTIAFHFDPKTNTGLNVLWDEIELTPQESFFTRTTRFGNEVGTLNPGDSNLWNLTWPSIDLTALNDPSATGPVLSLVVQDDQLQRDAGGAQFSPRLVLALAKLPGATPTTWLLGITLTANDDSAPLLSRTVPWPAAAVDWRLACQPAAAGNSMNFSVGWRGSATAASASAVWTTLGTAASTWSATSRTRLAVRLMTTVNKGGAKFAIPSAIAMQPGAAWVGDLTTLWDLIPRQQSLYWKILTLSAGVSRVDTFLGQNQLRKQLTHGNLGRAWASILNSQNGASTTYLASRTADAIVNYFLERCRVDLLGGGDYGDYFPFPSVDNAITGSSYFATQFKAHLQNFAQDFVNTIVRPTNNSADPADPLDAGPVPKPHGLNLPVDALGGLQEDPTSSSWQVEQDDPVRDIAGVAVLLREKNGAVKPWQCLNMSRLIYLDQNGDEQFLADDLLVPRRLSYQNGLRPAYIEYNNRPLIGGNRDIGEASGADEVTDLSDYKLNNGAPSRYERDPKTDLPYDGLHLRFLFSFNSDWGKLPELRFGRVFEAAVMIVENSGALAKEMIGAGLHPAKLAPFATSAGIQIPQNYFRSLRYLRNVSVGAGRLRGKISGEWKTPKTLPGLPASIQPLSRELVRSRFSGESKTLGFGDGEYPLSTPPWSIEIDAISFAALRGERTIIWNVATDFVTFAIQLAHTTTAGLTTVDASLTVVGGPSMTAAISLLDRPLYDLRVDCVSYSHGSVTFQLAWRGSMWESWTSLPAIVSAASMPTKLTLMSVGFSEKTSGTLVHGTPQLTSGGQNTVELTKQVSNPDLGDAQLPLLVLTPSGPANWRGPHEWSFYFNTASTDVDTWSRTSTEGPDFIAQIVGATHRQRDLATNSSETSGLVAGVPVLDEILADEHLDDLAIDQTLSIDLVPIYMQSLPPFPLSCEVKLQAPSPPPPDVSSKLLNDLLPAQRGPLPIHCRHVDAASRTACLEIVSEQSWQLRVLKPEAELSIVIQANGGAAWTTSVPIPPAAGRSMSDAIRGLVNKGKTWNISPSKPLSDYVTFASLAHPTAIAKASQIKPFPPGDEPVPLTELWITTTEKCRQEGLQITISVSPADGINSTSKTSQALIVNVAAGEVWELRIGQRIMKSTFDTTFASYMNADWPLITPSGGAEQYYIVSPYRLMIEAAKDLETAKIVIVGDPADAKAIALLRWLTAADDDGRSYYARIIPGSSLTRPLVNGQDLVIVQTVNPADLASVAAILSSSRVPVIVCSLDVADSLGLFVAGSSGSVQANLIDVNAQAPAKLSAQWNGKVQISDQPQPVPWAVPIAPAGGTAPIVVATELNDVTQPVIFAYASGAALRTGTALAARLVFLASPTSNDNASRLFGAAASWALGPNLEEQLWQALTPRWNGTNVDVLFDRAGFADFLRLSRIDVLQQVWRWQGIPTARFPFESQSAGQIDVVPGNCHSPAPTVCPAWWDAEGFAQRTDDDYQDIAVPLRLRPAVQSLYNENLTQDLRARYHRYSAIGYSRYAGWAPKDHVLAGRLLNDFGANGEEGIDPWRRMFVPCRRTEPLPKPKIKLLLPLTEADQNHAPSMLVVLNEPWFDEAGLGETLEADVELRAVWAESTTPSPSTSPQQEPSITEFGPDPILDGSGAKPAPSVVFDVEGPVGLTFDTGTSEPLYVTSWFVITPRLLTATNTSLDWWFAKIKFCRTVTAEAMTSTFQNGTGTTTISMDQAWNFNSGPFAGPTNVGDSVNYQFQLFPGSPVLQFTALRTTTTKGEQALGVRQGGGSTTVEWRRQDAASQTYSFQFQYRPRVPAKENTSGATAPSPTKTLDLVVDAYVRTDDFDWQPFAAQIYSAVDVNQVLAPSLNGGNLTVTAVMRSDASDAYWVQLLPDAKRVPLTPGSGGETQFSADDLGLVSQATADGRPGLALVLRTDPQTPQRFNDATITDSRCLFRRMLIVTEMVSDARGQQAERYIDIFVSDQKTPSVLTAKNKTPFNPLANLRGRAVTLQIRLDDLKNTTTLPDWDNLFDESKQGKNESDAGLRIVAVSPPIELLSPVEPRILQPSGRRSTILSLPAV